MILEYYQIYCRKFHRNIFSRTHQILLGQRKSFNLVCFSTHILLRKQENARYAISLHFSLLFLIFICSIHAFGNIVSYKSDQTQFLKMVPVLKNFPFLCSYPENKIILNMHPSEHKRVARQLKKIRLELKHNFLYIYIIHKITLLTRSNIYKINMGWLY